MKRVFLILLVVILSATAACNSPVQFRRLQNVTPVASTLPTADPAILERLPDTVKFNPELNEYYDSSVIEWNDETHQYDPVSLGVTPGGALDPDIYSMDEWVVDHTSSANPLDRAMCAFLPLLNKFMASHVTSSKADRPLAVIGKVWTGPYREFGKVSLAELPRLYSYVSDPACPFSDHLYEGFTLLISRIDPNEWLWHGDSAALFKQYKGNVRMVELARFSSFVSVAETFLPSLLDEKLSSESKAVILSRFGVAGLPFIYDQVIVNGNLEYADFIYEVLPTWVLIREEDAGRQISAETDRETMIGFLEECFGDVVGVSSVGEMKLSG